MPGLLEKTRRCPQDPLGGLASGHPQRMKTKPKPNLANSLWPPFSHLISKRGSGGDLPPLAPPATLECNLNGDAERLHDSGGLAKWTPFT